ncbi:glycoside hydrolase superfamily [Immersiella caudata]|uniref:Glycoside hydrolase superfamily n=1 Tax=Immersiella caudata TaxID=314043 RepID=A0AA40BUY6_9PEZI|nr:glycoside hydrolase superfamily [Immersiella caudata]
MGSIAVQEETIGEGRPWWKAATFYQVYPASFKDSNDDGWGDLPGLLSKVDYLHALGVDCIWVSPIFESPQKDMGYDVSDYQKIYAPYGSIEDVDTLVAACHDRGMRVILDLVVNHTSIEHAWFQESRSSKDSPKRDWYIWKPARYDSNGLRHPPTNWRGYFAGSTWTWDEHTQEYYLHLYAPEQPDLNWENKECREAIYEDTMRFWLRRGVDGFRIDTVNKYSKRTEYVDATITDPFSPYQAAPEMWCNGPRIHEFIREINQVLAPYSAVSVGELSNTPDPKGVLPYVSAKAKELDMVFEFSVIRLGNGDLFSGKYIYKPFPLSQLKSLTEKWQCFIEGTDGWTTVFCENHDNGRAVSRFGDPSTPELWRASAKTIALWQTTLSGTLFLYQGQEIGMTNMPTSWDITHYKDVEAVSFFAEAMASGDEERIRKTRHGLGILARDHARLPFRWNEDENVGFTTDETNSWMRIPQERGISVESQSGDEQSVLEFYRRTLALRQEHQETFVFGTHQLLDRENESTWAYVKEGFVVGRDGTEVRRRALVVMNFTAKMAPLMDVSRALGCARDEVRLMVTTGGKEEGLDDGALSAWEGRVYCDFDLDMATSDSRHL